MRKHYLALASCISVVAIIGAVAPIQAHEPQQPDRTDLPSETGLRIDGAGPGDWAGLSVDEAGDVNGDGRPDLIVGAPWTGQNGRDLSGSAYVIFGDKDPVSPLDLNSIGDRGFRIDGASADDWAGLAVAGTGDVNDDGLDDVIVGALYADQNGRDKSGSAYVVFGKGSNDKIDLADVGTSGNAEGFRIDGGQTFDQAGFAVDGAGDMNGDGRPDLIVGAPYSGYSGIHPPFMGRVMAGSTYVVFGKGSTDTIDLRNIGTPGSTQGFRIDGEDIGDLSGTAVAKADDVNGDGLADLIVGARFATNNYRHDSGSSYVIFGDQSTDLIDLRFLGQRGFRIDGAETSDVAGWSVAGVGDMSGDELADLIVGAPYADNNDRHDSGSTYVVFGRASNDAIDLRNLGDQGFQMDGAAAGDKTGSSVAGVGDVNGDGINDVIFGAPEADKGDHLDMGAAFVVFGKRLTSLNSAIDLDRLLNRGRRFDGASAGDLAGTSVANGGDVNGDGHPELVVGAPGDDQNGRDSSGSVYVVYSIGPGLQTDPGRAFSTKGKAVTGKVSKSDSRVQTHAPSQLRESGPRSAHALTLSVSEVK